MTEPDRRNRLPLSRPAVVVLALIVVGAVAAGLTGGRTHDDRASATTAAEQPAPRHGNGPVVPPTARRCARGSTGAGGRRCASVDPSGVRAPVGNLPGWREVFVDDFAAKVPLGSFPGVVRSRWNPYPRGWKDTSGNGTYWPQKGLSQHDGMLDIWLHTEKVNGVDTHIVNAPQPVLPGPRRGQLYGRYVIRFKSDPVPGYKTAWLLWPDSGDRAEGEIDFPEGDLDGTITAFKHERVTTSGKRLDAYPTTATYTHWHTAVVEWLPNRLTFKLDGRVVGSSSVGIPDAPMHYVIQTETQLSGGAPADSASGHVYIDWVAIYARS